jgi:hypothetical protein
MILALAEDKAPVNVPPKFKVVDWPEASSFRKRDSVYGLAVKWSGAVRGAELNERMFVATISELPTACESFHP